MKLSLHPVTRFRDGRLGSASVVPLSGVSINYTKDANHLDGKYAIETNGALGDERFDTPEKAVEYLEKQH